MSEGELKGIVFLLVTGGILILSAWRSRRRLRLVADTIRSKAASAPQGFVELEGFAWPAQDTLRIHGDVEAVFYTLILQREETRGTGKQRRKVWVTVYSFGHSPLMYLVDATGVVSLDPAKAELNLGTTTTRSWRSLPLPEKERIRQLASSVTIAGFPPSNFLFGLLGTKFRVVESHIAVGSPVYATGDFRTIHGEPTQVKASGLTDFYRKVFDKESRALKPLDRLLDTDGDGKVSASELHNGYTMAARVARQKVQREPGPEDAFDVHGSLGTSDSHKLFLADTTEEHLKVRLGRWLYFRYVGGAACIALGIAMATGFHGERLNWATPRRAVAAVNEAPPKTALWHQGCVQNQADDCVRLLNHPRLVLTSEQRRYYRHQACRSFKEYCDQ